MKGQAEGGEKKRVVSVGRNIEMQNVPWKRAFMNRLIVWIGERRKCGRVCRGFW